MCCCVFDSRVACIRPGSWRTRYWKSRAFVCYIRDNLIVTILQIEHVARLRWFPWFEASRSICLRDPPPVVVTLGILSSEDECFARRWCPWAADGVRRGCLEVGQISLRMSPHIHKTQYIQRNWNHGFISEHHLVFLQPPSPVKSFQTRLAKSAIVRYSVTAPLQCWVIWIRWTAEAFNTSTLKGREFLFIPGGQTQRFRPTPRRTWTPRVLTHAPRSDLCRSSRLAIRVCLKTFDQGGCPKFMFYTLLMQGMCCWRRWRRWLGKLGQGRGNRCGKPTCAHGHRQARSRAPNSCKY